MAAITNSRQVKLRAPDPRPDPVVDAMISGLADGRVKPSISSWNLKSVYGSSMRSDHDLEACFVEACRSHAGKVGSVLVVTDKPGDEVLEQIGDPGGEIDDLWMARAFRKLASQLNLPSRWAQRFAEMPIYRMPLHTYEMKDGPSVSRYGDYLCSFVGSYGL